MKTKPYLLLLLIFHVLRSSAQNNELAMDSTLFAYYQKCERKARFPVILSMGDTLFRMAERLGDKRTQAAALCHKANYFYFTDKQDSLFKYMQLIQKFALTTNQPKYYYFIWERYIKSHIKMRKFNLALMELDNMRKKAVEDNYVPGEITCHNLMTQIYDIKANTRLAIEHLKKAIDLSEQYIPEDFNLCILYSNLANFLLVQGQPDEAYPYLQKAYEKARRPAHILNIQKNEAIYWQKKEKPQQLRRLIQEMQETGGPETGQLRYAEYCYAQMTGNYNKADKLLEQMRQSNYISQMTYIKFKLRDLRNIPGQENNLLEYYHQYLIISDSINKLDTQTSLEEFATLMEVSQLNRKNGELELRLSRQELNIIYGFLIGLVVLGAVMCMFTIKVIRLNRKLKRSQTTLVEKNRTLMKAKRLIIKEKEHAESASRMKTAFIQNMSHEIRTPLNSIVGFSHVLADELAGQENIKTYVDIITENSNNLLKLIGDIIEISSLDAVDKQDEKTPVFINNLCEIAIRQVEGRLADGVSMIFNAWKNDFPVISNEKHIITVLVNLLHNAVKFTSQGMISLECRLSQNSRYIEISVTDTGPGIPEDKQEWVFERFTKVDDFTQGTGLGLPISRLAAQQIGGTVKIDPGYNQGCRVWFVFPVEKN